MECALIDLYKIHMKSFLTSRRKSQTFLFFYSNNSSTDNGNNIKKYFKFLDYHFSEGEVYVFGKKSFLLILCLLDVSWHSKICPKISKSVCMLV